MKIAYVVPGILDLEELERRDKILKRWAFPGTEIEIVGIKEGPASVESMYEEYLSIPDTARTVSRLEKEGWDAAIIGCAGDPGLDAMREITRNMLVVGPGQTSMQVAAMLGHRFSLLAVTASTVASGYDLAYKAGVQDKLVSVRPLDIPVLDLARDRSGTIKKIARIGREAVEEDGADVLVLGCMSMGFLDVAADVADIIKIPVINPALVAVKITESLVASNLQHSKQAFMFPPKLAEGKVNNLDELMVRRDDIQ
ncbi:MAG: aspartate/glutamate racemase family protein [Bacillota bacterium]